MSGRFDHVQVDQLLSDVVERGRVPNVAAVVADRTGVLYEGAAGTVQTPGGVTPVTPRTHIQIKSMTKLVTTVAALQLVEQGRLDLDAPVEHYLPEFAGLEVLDGIVEGAPRLRAPASRATVRQLLTHTTGLGYWLFSEDLRRFEEITGLPNVSVSADMGPFRAPLLADPGTRWIYGLGADWLGRVIETITGDGLDAVVQSSITGPLKMTDTSFMLDEAQQAAENQLHVQNEDGGWNPVGHALIDRPWLSGGEGLHSTPRDYLRFQQALLRDGELDGARILQPETVAAIFTPQIGDIPFPEEMPTAVPWVTDTVRLGSGRTWGYGLLLNVDDIPGGRRTGSGGWFGLFNSQFWIDRSAGICASIYTCTLPFMAQHGPANLFTDFEHAVYASL